MEPCIKRQIPRLHFEPVRGRARDLYFQRCPPTSPSLLHVSTVHMGVGRPCTHGSSGQLALHPDSGWWTACQTDTLYVLRTGWGEGPLGERKGADGKGRCPPEPPQPCTVNSGSEARKTACICNSQQTCTVHLGTRAPFAFQTSLTTLEAQSKSEVERLAK